MSGRQRRSERDRRRRSLGQNFLVDQKLIHSLVANLDIAADELVVDLGAGGGALTLPLAAAGARLWAVERDPAWAAELAERARSADGADRIRVIRADLRRLRLPKEPFRVVANPPFGLTTEVLRLLLDDPDNHLRRADLILQRQVARKHADEPPTLLKTAAWAPWWRFSSGRTIPASAFRPRPSVDAAVLHITRRDPPVLPTWLAADLEQQLRPVWQPPQGDDQRRRGRPAGRPDERRSRGGGWPAG